MKTNRQLHLWIGLICSVLILIESITGLLLSEPWLMGAEERGGMRHEQAFNPQQQSSTSDSQNPDQSTFQPDERRAQGGLTMFVRQLHEGRIGSTNVKWLADLAAVSMIFLTITGITLSCKTLRAQRIRRKKQLESAEESEVEHS